MTQHQKVQATLDCAPYLRRETYKGNYASRIMTLPLPQTISDDDRHAAWVRVAERAHHEQVNQARNHTREKSGLWPAQDRRQATTWSSPRPNFIAGVKPSAAV